MTDALAFLLDYYQIQIAPDQTLPVEIAYATREQLPEIFAALNYTEGAEIGVWRGSYSKMLCDGVPNLHLRCVDPWLAHAAYPDHRRQSKLDESHAIAREALAPYNCTFMRQFSMDAVKEVPDRCLDFVYIDGNHRYDCVVEDLTHWSPKVKHGGIIAGHDYAFIAEKHFCHVVWAVNGYTASWGIRPWFVLGRGRDVRRLRGHNPNRYRSFLWVNP